MAKAKRDFSADVDDVFNPKPKQEKPVQAVPEKKPVEVVPVIEEVKELPKKVQPEKKKEYVPVGYYVTQEQKIAVKMRAIASKDPKEKDASAIVRLAIDEYLERHP